MNKLHFIFLCMGIALTTWLMSCMMPDDELVLNDVSLSSLVVSPVTCVANKPGSLQLSASVSNPDGVNIRRKGFVIDKGQSFFGDKAEHYDVSASTEHGEEFGAETNLTAGLEYSVTAYVITDNDIIVKGETLKNVKALNFDSFVRGVEINVKPTNDGIIFETEMEGDYDDVFFSVDIIEYNFYYNWDDWSVIACKQPTTQTGNKYTANVNIKSSFSSTTVEYILCIREGDKLYKSIGRRYSYNPWETSKTDAQHH